MVLEQLIQSLSGLLHHRLPQQGRAAQKSTGAENETVETKTQSEELRNKWNVKGHV